MGVDADLLGFSPDWDVPVRYIERTHAWYDALGTANPYRYASYADVPFEPMHTPLARARIALLTTAAPFDPAKGPQGAGAPYNAGAKFYKAYSGDTGLEHDLRISHLGIDRRQQTDDANCWFPLPALRGAAAAGRIGPLAPRFHGVPTNRSQRHTIEVDCPDVLARCREDAIDAAIRNAFSFESTSWYEPSNSVTFTSTTGKPASTPFGSVSTRPLLTAGMNSRGTVPPLIASTNSKPLPASFGSSLIQTWPYWPRPPDCLTNLPSISATSLRMVSR
jgi:hypothetical protein